MERSSSVLFGLACGVMLLCALAGRADAEIEFEHHYIDSSGPPGTHWGCTTVADLNNDGLPDVVVGRSKWGDDGPRGVFWYANQEGGIRNWSGRRAVHEGGHVGCGASALDVDDDGWTDIVCDGVWFRNPGPPRNGEEFERFEFDGRARGAHDLLAHDMDGEGSREVVVYLEHQERGGLFIYEIPENPREQWPRTVVREMDDTVHAAIAPGGIGDVSGDGAPDIVFVSRWFENPAENGDGWTEHSNFDFRDTGPWGPAVRTFTADIDGDGRLDFVQSECDMPEARIAWFRNAAGDGAEWQMHRLPQDSVPGDFHSLVVGDFDLDGDPDVYADEMEHIHVQKGDKSKVGMHIWENVDGRGTRWQKHTLKTGLGGHQAKAADFDGDGDLDIVTRPYTANNTANDGRMHLSVLENKTK